jgi:hypothetical protein
MIQPSTLSCPPTEAVAEPQLAAIEVSLERAAAVLLNPSLEQLQACRFELESIVERLEQVRNQIAQGRILGSSGISSRLRLLQRRVFVVRALIRQGAAFYRNAEQGESGVVLGYTPRGLERAL